MFTHFPEWDCGKLHPDRDEDLREGYNKVEF
jgi:hypothetical protein